MGWPTSGSGEIAQRVLPLASELRAQLEPRLAARLIDGFAADAKTSGLRRSAAKRGADLVAAVRRAVTRSGASKGVQAAHGAGSSGLLRELMHIGDGGASTRPSILFGARSARGRRDRRINELVGCLPSVLASTLLLVGCGGGTPLAHDGGGFEPDTTGFHGCVWVPRPMPICDRIGQQACALWAAQLVGGSDLESFGQCDLNVCWAADQAPASHQTACGSSPACADGYACGRLPRETEAHCIRCEP